ANDQVPPRRPGESEAQRDGGSGGSAVGFDKVDRILDRHDLFGRIIRDLAPEFLLKGHHKLNRVEAVGTQIVYETGVLGHLRLVDAQMFDDDLFDPIVDVTHPSFSSLDYAEVVSAQGVSAPSAITVSPPGAALQACEKIPRFPPPFPVRLGGNRISRSIPWPYRR